MFLKFNIVSSDKSEYTFLPNLLQYCVKIEKHFIPLPRKCFSAIYTKVHIKHLSNWSSACHFYKVLFNQ